MIKMKFFIYFGICFFTNEALGLQSCSEEPTKPNFCQKVQDYRPQDPPPPLRIITTVLDIKDILEVNVEEKSMTISVNLILKWVDPRLSYHGPEGVK